MDTPEFQIQVETLSNYTSVDISGELTINTSKAVYQKLLIEAHPVNKLNIRISEPVSLDLSFLQILITLIKSRKDKDLQTSIKFEFGNNYLELLEKTGIIQTIELLQK